MAFPNGPAPDWYLHADWVSAGRKRNGVFYEGDTISLKFDEGGFPVLPSSGLTSSFGSGVPGAVPQTTDWGSATAYSSISGAPVYDGAHAHSGSQSLRLPGASYGTVAWTYGSTAPDPEFFRMFVYATSNPSSMAHICWSAAANFLLDIDSSGHILVKQAMTTLATFSTPISLNQWVRVEGSLSASTGAFQVRLFNDADSPTATESQSATAPTFAPNNTFNFGTTSGFGFAAYGSDVWLDDIVAAATAWPGPTVAAAPGGRSYEIVDLAGSVVSAGTAAFSPFTPQAPAGGWRLGWYRCYMTGPQTDALFGDSYGATNFCIIRNNANFTAMPVAPTDGDPSDQGNDFVMKGVMGLGTSRLSVSDAADPSGEIAGLQSQAAVSATYWSANGLLDSARTSREMFCQFPNGTTDSLSWANVSSGTYGRFYPADGTVNGANLYVTISAGTNPSTDKVQVFYPDSVTLVETFDNLASSAAAQTALAASAYVKFFDGGAGSPLASHSGPTAIGWAFHSGVSSVVSSLYTSGVHYFEGPSNEPNLTAETAHQMKLFQAAVHAGNASAKAMGPCHVNIFDDYSAFFAAGGGGFCDAISFHAYNAVTNGDLNLGESQISAFLAQLSAAGLSGKELWQTESTQATVIPYGVYHPRRGRVMLAEWMLFEKHGIPKERNNPWYDVSNGFWDFPAWLENGDGSLEPAAPLGRVYSEELFGKPYASSLNFGVPGNHIVIGNVYTAPGGTSTVVLLATSFVDNLEVELAVSGGTPSVVDCFGNAVSARFVGGVLSLQLQENPVYVNLASGTSVTRAGLGEYWGEFGNSLSPSAASATVAGASWPAIADGAYMTNYGTSAGISPNTIVGAGDDIVLSWTIAQTIGKVVAWLGPAWQASGTLIRFNVDTTSDGVNWTTQATVTKTSPPPYRQFATDSGTQGCQYETFWDEQWVFFVPFAGPVQATSLRLAVAEASYGGEPAAALGTGIGQGWPTQSYKVEEIAVFSEPGGRAMPDTHKNFAVSTVATAPVPAASGTSLVVAAAQGARFPAIPFNATIWPASTQPDPTNAEIVRVTAISTDTFTITRAQESSSARSIVAGDQIAATVTAKTLTDAEGMPLALTGATAATRYVGGTASGAPVSGTFAVGDFVIDQTGAVFVCTVAGSPGTWAQVGGGGGGSTPVLHSLTVNYNDAGLASTGVTIFTPAVGDLLYDFWVQPVTVWNGTTPKGDFGTFTGGTNGLFAEYASTTLDMTVPNPGSISNPDLASPTLMTWQKYGTGRPAMNVITSAPLKFIVSSTGQKGGADPGATQGRCIVRVISITP